VWVPDVSRPDIAAKAKYIRQKFSPILVALYNFRAQQVFMFHKVETTVPFNNIKMCCAQQTQLALLQDKLRENDARPTR